MYKRKLNWMPFEEARAFVRTLKLKNTKEWLDYLELGNPPQNIPKTPQVVYKDKGWNGMGDWLGTGAIQAQKKDFLPFKEARKFVHLLHIKTEVEWIKYSKSGLRPHNIPASPRIYYSEQKWKGMSDWLGNMKLSREDYLPYEEARKIALKQRLKTKNEWLEWCKSGKKPLNIPIYPNSIYKNHGWNGWLDWLGPR